MAKLNGRKIPKLYDLFNKNPFSGKGVSKKDDLPRTFKNFFKLSWWHIGKITSVNMLFLMGIFPVIFLMIGFSGYLNDVVSSPASSIYSVLYGAFQNGGSDPVNAAFYGVHGIHGYLSVTSVASKVMYALGALVVFTFGFANVGTTYILRNLIKGEPVFVWHDFWYAIKRNLKQGFIMGILDVLFLMVLTYDIIFFFFNMGSYTSSVLFFASILLMAIYLIMRFYIYNVMITFDLSLFKILKNSFIFSALGLKRNLVALLAIVIIFLLDYFLLLVLLPLGIMLPFIFLYGYCAYIASYAAWAKIKEFMIDPYVKEETVQPDNIFNDDVE